MTGSGAVPVLRKIEDVARETVGASAAPGEPKRRSRVLRLEVPKGRSTNDVALLVDLASRCADALSREEMPPSAV